MNAICRIANMTPDTICNSAKQYGHYGSERGYREIGKPVEPCYGFLVWNVIKSVRSEDTFSCCF